MKGLYTFIFLMLLCCLCVQTACATDLLCLSRDIHVIEQEAFYNSVSITEVVLPEGIEEIGPRAFAKSALLKINLPASLKRISDDAFADCPGLIATVIPGSAGHTHCVENDIEYVFPSGVVDITNFEYEIADRQATITRYIGSEKTLTVPETIEGCPVTAIASRAFFECYSLESVVLPDSITVIGESAFKDCKYLNSVTLPANLAEIGNFAFYGCDLIDQISLPASLAELNNYAFYGCSSLREIVIPDGITDLGNYTFYECTSLAKITVPDHLRRVGNYAFAYCSVLEEVMLPDTVNSIGDYAFTECLSVNAFHMPESLTIIRTGSFYKFGAYGDGIELIIPDGVTRLCRHAFCSSGFTSENLIIPDSVTHFGDAFHCSAEWSGCAGIKALTLPDDLKQLPYSYISASGGHVPVYCCWGTATSELAQATELNLFYIDPDQPGITYRLETDTAGSRHAVICEYSGSTAELDLSAKYRGLPVTAIDSYAFSGNSSLILVTIPEGITAIGSSAFSECTKLTRVTIPEGVTTIASYTFYNCSSLNDIAIPGSVDRIGSSAFENCTALTSAAICEGVTTIDSSAFKNCSKLSNVSIPESLTGIGSYAFYGCESLEELTILANISSIGHDIFPSGAAVYCVHGTSTAVLLESLNNVYYIDPSNMDFAYALVYDSASATRYAHLQKYRGSAQTVIVPNSFQGYTVIGIRSSAFAGSDSLTGVILSKNITRIDPDTFSGFANLTVYVAENSYAHEYCAANSIRYELIA